MPKTDDVTRASDGFADGLWHNLKIEVTNKKVNCTVDRNVKVSNRELDITPASMYYIGKQDFDIWKKALTFISQAS